MWTDSLDPEEARNVMSWEKDRPEVNPNGMRKVDKKLARETNCGTCMFD
jgi:hypothetical protein